MDARVVARFESTLPADDDHPYRTGPWRPNVTEWHVADCDVVGELPADLNGVYLRNTENPLHPALGRYHPFDGDAMLHGVEFANGTATYRNRFVRTAGFEAELAAGGPLWAGLAEPPSRPQRDGWGARTRTKDASSTDVVVHAGRALTSFYQCGDLYAVDPSTLEQLGAVCWNGWSRPRVCRRTRKSIRSVANCSSSTTRRRRPNCTTASWTPTTRSPTTRRSTCPVLGSLTTWRSPRTTPSSTTVRCSGIPTCSPVASMPCASTPNCRRALSAGPIARVQLPERICAGTHSTWLPATA